MTPCTCAIRACRITPAGAGKTYLDMPDWAKAEDHPRRCGENVMTANLREWRHGSPPQVRGKHPPQLVRRRFPGITPAGAGKTVNIVYNFAVIGDHPRRCGENSSINTKIPAYPGSPPQVRGKLVRTGDYAYVAGITPAGAGKT